jgi:CRISPR system Cascade subunit CasE
MFLSKVRLNPRHRMTYRLLADLYMQHRFVMSAFPDLLQTDGSEEGSQRQQGVLYRLDTAKQSEEIFFLVQSIIAPDWEKSDTLHRAAICSVNQGEWNPAVVQGERYRFRLRASPTVCRVNRDLAGVRQKAKREGLFTEEAQRDWLVRTAARGGFGIEMNSVLVTPQGKLEGIKPPNDSRSSDNRVRCFTVDFDGVLFVAQPDQFMSTLRDGVGRGKAWGCGLLSVLRAR